MIRVDISKCTGCKRCETACSVYRSGSVGPDKARVRVINHYADGVDGPVVCQQCKERFCTDCPSNAITLGPQGQVIVSATLCTLCGKCRQACPIGAVEIFDGIVYVCDLCGGAPRCVGACTEGAVTFDPGPGSPGGTVSLETLKAETRKARMNAAERRAHYIKTLGRDLGFRRKTTSGNRDQETDPETGEF